MDKKTAYIIKNRVPADVADDIFNQVQEAERNGLFDEMFKSECVPFRENTSREQLLSEMKPGASFPVRETMLKVFAYSITDPMYAVIFFERLEELGCKDALKEYERIVREYKEKHEAEIKTVAKNFFEHQEDDKKECRKKAKSGRINQITSAILRKYSNS